MLLKALKKIWETWKKIALKIGAGVTAVLLSVVYFVGIGITSVIMKLARKDTLDKRFTDAPTFWLKKEKTEASLERAKRQF